jgi:hypothetical protein
MNRRALVMVLAGVIAAAVAIPALADSGTTAKSASVRGLSKRSLAKAKVALRLSRGAKRVSHQALGSAKSAQIAASAAQTSAAGALKAAEAASMKAGGAELNSKEAKAEVAAIRSKIGFAEGSVSTESPSFVKLSGGPSVTVTVPTSNLIQVWGQALVEGEGTDEGAVSLFEDGHQVEGQADCGGSAEGVLFSASSPGAASLVGTPAVPGLLGCATLGAPGPVLFRTTTGEHSFELRYAACTCGAPPAEKVTFSERRLVVQPLP